MRRVRVRREGFTFLEIVVVVAILTILAGIAVPMGARTVIRAKREATRAEMQRISEALLAHFEVESGWPKGLQTLIDDGYIGGGFDATEAIQDEWGTPYVFEAKGSVATLRSLGADKVESKDDEILAIDARPTLRSITLDEMETIHVALRSYEIERGKGNLGDLPADWLGDEKLGVKGALDLLVEEGYLPGKAVYAADAWGVAYTYGGSPADFVTSGSL